MSDECQLTPEARKAEEDWKAAHGRNCPCWKCMHVKGWWADALGREQGVAERAIALADEILRGYDLLWRRHIPCTCDHCCQGAPNIDAWRQRLLEEVRG